ncbi:carboxypeptidase-like regulatory domain-containing protein, partial [Nocardioides sp.]|uniref:carboxypeptidase-like regulatory domain-containing protein n=1 Tax=Nocardioides sp. TaxID=35761 RepID=UPI00286DCB47
MDTSRPSRPGRLVGLLLLVLGLVLAPLGAVFAAEGDGPPSTLSGVVQASDGTPLQGATVTLYDDFQAPTGPPQVTGAGGTFSFGSLADGFYYVGATKAGAGTVYYDNAADLFAATPLFVDFAAGSTATLRMPAPPDLAGTVSNAAGPIELADVTAYRFNAGSWTFADSTSTDASGHYAFTALTAQDYRLQFQANGQVQEYWNDKPTLDAADSITVVPDVTKTANAVLADPLRITGTVTGTGGTPLNGATVTAEQRVTEFGATFWDYVDSVLTPANGTYSLQVPPGQMRIRFEAATYMSEYYDDALDAVDADPVTVTTASVPNINAALVVGGKITGTVRDNANAAIPSASVTAYRLVGGTWTYVSGSSTNASGVYTIDGLRAGTYRVGFSSFGGGFLDEYYQDKDTVQTATDVPVALGGTATVDANLDKGGVISGTVTGPSGAVSGAAVRIYEPYRFSQSGWDLFDSTSTTVSGAYSFIGLRPGAYRVCVDQATGLAPECFNDKAEVFSADSITAAKNTTTPANILLAAARKVTGTVTSRAGGALNGASV